MQEELGGDASVIAVEHRFEKKDDVLRDRNAAGRTPHDGDDDRGDEASTD